MTRCAILQLMLAGVAWAMAGCQPGVKPDPGLAALRVKVIAEPKVGAPVDDSRGSGYDSGPAQRPNPAFETLDYSNLPDIVVWLEPAYGTSPVTPTVPDVSIEVTPEQPHAGRVVAVSVGQKVVFHNTGSKTGGIYSVSDGNEFSLAAVPPDGTGSYTVRSPGPIEVLTDPAAREPLAELYAAPSRWVQAARSGDQLIFNNVPPGQYRLVSWHPRLPGTESVVTLQVNAVTDATIKVGVNDLPKVTSK